jgi:hypothetical protein
MPDSSNSIPERISDAAQSLLERLTEFRSLILCLGFIMYLDTWLLQRGNVNPLTIEIGAVIQQIETISLGSFVLFFVSYSLLMTATFPAMRTFYRQIASIWFPSNRSRALSEDESQLSSWCLALVLFTVSNAFSGLFHHENYRGFSWYLMSNFANEGFMMGVFRLSAILLIIGSLMRAFQRD